jgi:sigma-B regulation protein RsbU (phosphoserine phosphatase)
MIDRSALPVVEGMSATFGSTLIQSSAIRSCDGSERCGDVAFVVPLETGRTGIVVIDVAGHGAARAPIAWTLAAEISASLQVDGSPAAALGQADERLCAVDDESPYAVAFVAVVHPVSRTVVYASAGFDAAFALADNGRIRHLPPTATMLGISLAKHACDAVFTLSPNETLVIATDGISDSRPAGSHDFFGATGTALAVLRSRIAGTDPALAVLEAARAHEGAVQADDDAVLVVRLQPPGHHRNASKGTIHALDHHRRAVRPLALGV